MVLVILQQVLARMHRWPKRNVRVCMGKIEVET